VHTTHPRAREFLFRDCFHMHRFFTGVGVACPSAAATFSRVCGEAISPEQEVEFMRKVSAAKGRALRDEEDSSRVCEQMFLVSRENPAALLAGLDQASLAAAENEDEEESGDGDDDSFVRVALTDAAEGPDTFDDDAEESEGEEEEEEEEEDESEADSESRGARCGPCDDEDGLCSDEAADRPE
jgi:serine/threonine-protein kinase RIO1